MPMTALRTRGSVPGAPAVDRRACAWGRRQDRGIPLTHVRMRAVGTTGQSPAHRLPFPGLSPGGRESPPNMRMLPKKATKPSPTSRFLSAFFSTYPKLACRLQDDPKRGWNHARSPVNGVKCTEHRIAKRCSPSSCLSVRHSFPRPEREGNCQSVPWLFGLVAEPFS